MGFDEVEPKVKKDKYELEDPEYLLIKTLQQLTTAIRMLARKNG